MAFSESIYLIIIFTLPAAIHIIYNTYIRCSPRIQADKSVELAENIIFCLITFVFSILLFRNHIQEFAEYIIMSNEDKTCYLIANPNFNFWKYIVNYTLITFGVSIIAIVAWYSIGKKIFRWIINLNNKIWKRPIELDFSDIWRSLFETEEFIKKFDCCIVIEKAGVMITAGMLQAYQPPHLHEKEILLYNTEKVQEILQDDKGKPPEERLFYPALYEYYDVNSDMLMKFYSLDKYDEKFNQHSDK